MQRLIKCVFKSLLTEPLNNSCQMDKCLGYSYSERSHSDYHNGYKNKLWNTSYKSMDIKIFQDSKSTFDPQIVKKY